MTINSAFDIGEMVYILTDKEQEERQVVSFEVQAGGSIIYVLQFGTSYSKHYAIELSRTKKVI